ncbi:MAG: AAA family ATPase [Gemmatimonadota bacterium]|nr:AAA family ATPase [Gemmatimonadota bacterium]
MKEIYDWVPWFRELARNIAEGGEAFLIDRAKKVAWGENQALLQYGDAAIDPFSFFYFLASKATRHQLKPVYDSVGDVFEMKTPRADGSVDDSYTIPSSSRNWLFHGDSEFSPDMLWRLFRQAEERNPDINPRDFKSVMKIKNVAVVKLTHALFLINPEYFQPVDNLTAELSEVLGLPAPSDLRSGINRSGDYERYLSFIKQLMQAFPGCRPYEINMFLYLTKPKAPNRINVSDKFYHISTNVFEDGDCWENRDGSFKENNWVYTGEAGPGKSWEEDGSYPLTEPARGDIVLVRTGVQKGRAIGVVQRNDYTELGVNKDSRIHVLWVNKTDAELSRQTRQDAFEKIKPDWQTYQAFQEADSYKPTFDLINMLTGNRNEPMKNLHPLNQILYGPPGTGKTWNTADYALAIIEDESVDTISKKSREGNLQRFNELKENGQIEMVTFHQNYNYEDFIEGIRPVLDSVGSGSVEYQLVPGVFRRIVKRADENRRQSELASGESWDIDALIEAFAKSIEERLESREEIKLFPPDNKSGVTIAKIHWSSGSFRSVQLGGTVKDHRLTKKVIIRDYGAFYRGEIKSAQDIKPTYRSTASQHGNAKRYFHLFQKIKQFHDREWKPEAPVSIEKQNYVLIIDEINRGNIAKIFGELITLIEESKRIGRRDATTVRLPNSDEDDDEFGVPDNLYIIGTMNTADRSIALLDTALRRRFEFVEMMPDPTLVAEDIEGVDCQKLLEAMNNRIRFLLDREHQIGHTYFMNIHNLTTLEAAFKNKIIPLLQEYFYDNWEKIDLVLNRNGFIHKTRIESDLFKDSDLIDDQSEIYELLPFDDGKWKDSEQYRKIYDSPKQSDTDESAQEN